MNIAPGFGSSAHHGGSRHLCLRSARLILIGGILAGPGIVAGEDPREQRTDEPIAFAAAEIPDVPDFVPPVERIRLPPREFRVVKDRGNLSGGRIVRAALVDDPGIRRPSETPSPRSPNEERLKDFGEPDPFLVTRVTETVAGTPGREVDLEYADGELIAVTDAAGIQSTFFYESPTDLSAVTSMTTPYGTTAFETTVFTRELSESKILYYTGLTITDPEGLKEHLLYAPLVTSSWFPDFDAASGVFGSGSSLGSLEPDEDPFHLTANARRTQLNRSVTLRWDKKAAKYHPPNFHTGANFQYATVSAWMFGTDYSQEPGNYVPRPYLEAAHAPGLGWRVSDFKNDQPGSANPDDFLPRATGHTTRNEQGTLDRAITTYEHTASGLPQVVTDPLGRRTEYVYAANGIDVIEVWVGESTAGQPGEFQVSEMAYDGPAAHLPTEIRDAANNKTSVEYNSNGQVTRITNALDEVLDFTYGWPTGFTDPTPGADPEDNDGFLQSVELTDPVAGNGISGVELLSLTYHPDTGYLHTVTDSLTGQTTTFDSYDALGRVTKITHPDQSTEEFFYESDGSKYLDPVRHVNREGQSTHYTYNGNRQLISIIDPELRNTRIRWCSCGHIGALIDALGRRTEWQRDLLGRVTDKILPDGKKISRTYEPESGRLETVTYPEEQDAAHASVDFDWHIDGSLARKTYPGDSDPFFAEFTYGGLLGRMATAKWHDEDGIQRTTHYGYHDLAATLGAGTTGNPGAGMLHTIDGPWANDTVVHTYDALNRPVGTDIAHDAPPHGSPSHQRAITAIDALGRIKQHLNDLGTFTTHYTGHDPRPDRLAYGSALFPFETDFDYLPAAQGGHLKTIHHTVGSATISKFDYTYAPDGKIATWTKEQDGDAKFTEFVDDLAGQLTKATTRQTDASGAILETLAYGYDRAGNRIAKTVDGDPFTANFNDRNQLTTGDFLGKVPFIGEMDEFARVSVTANGETQPARVRQHGSKWLFETEVELEPDGTTQVDVDATDVSDNTTSESFRIDSASGQWASLTYDDNGNTLTRTTTLGGVTTTTTYTWDRENRLETVTVGSVTERFVYNATGERVKIIRDPGGPGESERRFIWTGGHQPSQERDAANAVTADFFAEGERQDGVGTWLYTRDHLGSVREMVSASGTAAAYDYTPFGVRKPIGTPTAEATFGFTGHFHHDLTAHALTYYRAYDPELGRWLSPDPLESVTGDMAEMLSEGPNLYAYVGNDPLNHFDSFGLDRKRSIIAAILGLVAGGTDGDSKTIIKGERRPPPSIRNTDCPKPTAGAGSGGGGKGKGGKGGKSLGALGAALALKSLSEADLQKVAFHASRYVMSGRNSDFIAALAPVSARNGLVGQSLFVAMETAREEYLENCP